MPHFNHFPRPGEIDPYRLMQPQSWFQLSLSDYDVHDKCPRKQNKPVVTGPHAWLPLNELLGKQRMFALSIFARKGGRPVRRGVRSYAQCGCNVLAKF